MKGDLNWIESTLKIVAGYRKMIDAAVGQLNDEQLFARPGEAKNSVAVLLRHLGGNLNSRWSDFLTDDGEKPDRNRDSEFEDWEGDRQSLLEFFDNGWNCLVETLGDLEADDMNKSVLIRGEPHSVPEAILRTITHIAYHAGQLVSLARAIHGDNGWDWLTIRPGQSQAHNERTWGTSASRGIAGSQG